MPAAAASVHLQRLPSPALRRFSWGVLLYFVAVILWGTLVRATGSGAGCGDHWPLCNGTVMQHSARLDTIIEFTHRITSALSFFSAVALLVWTFAGTVRGHLARAAVVASVAFTLVEAILGALLVKLGLTAQSQSPLRPAYLALHLANTLLLLAALTLTAHLLNRRQGYLRGSIRLVTPLGAVAAIVVVMAALWPRWATRSFLPLHWARHWRRISHRPAAGWCGGAGRIQPSRSWPAFFSSGCWYAQRSAPQIGTIAGSLLWCCFCWQRNIFWACSTFFFWLQFGCRWHTCSAPTLFGSPW
jgi:heme A synthase